MSDERKIYFNTSKNVFSNLYEQYSSWEDFVNTIKSFRVIQMKVDDYEKLDNKSKGHLKDVGYFIFGKAKNGKRSDDNMVSREGLTLDFDDVTHKDMTNTITALENSNINYCLYTTASYNGSNGKFRLVLPFNRSIKPKDYERVAKKVVEVSALPKNIDEHASYTISQPFFFPTHLKDVNPIFKSRVNGEYLDVQPFLSQEQEQQNISDIKTSQTVKYSDIEAMELVNRYIQDKNNNLEEYQNFLSCMFSIIKGVEIKEISKEVAPKLIKLLAKGNETWEAENLEKYKREVEKGKVKTQYTFSRRFNQKQDSTVLSYLQERKITTATDLIEEKLTPVTFYIDKLLPQGVGWLSGSPKVGKSYMAMQIAHSVSSGEPFLGHDITKSAPVIYYSLEMGSNLVQARLKQMFSKSSLSNQFHILYSLPNFGNGLIEVLRHDIQQTNAKVLIIDVHGLISMNKSSQKPLYEQSYEEIKTFKKLADEFELSIILVTHLNKGMQGLDDFDRIMGSTGNRGATDFNIILGKDQVEKGNFIFKEESRKSEGAELVLSRESSTGLFECEGTLEEEKKVRSYVVHMENPIVKSVMDMMGDKEFIEVTATELLNNIPIEKRVDEKGYELTHLKLGHRIKKLRNDFQRFNGYVIYKEKKEKNYVYVIRKSAM